MACELPGGASAPHTGVPAGRPTRRTVSPKTRGVPGSHLGVGAVGGAGEGSAHQIAALTRWLRSHGVDFTDRAQFCKTRRMGVGGVALKAFDEGDVIFSLPLYGTPTGGVNAGTNQGEGMPPTDMRLEEADGTAGVRVPLVMTTSTVMAHDGPLGRLGRALAVCGLTVRGASGAAAPSPSHRLGGVQEADNDFPLRASHATLLALGVLHQSALASGPDPSHAHWRAYVELLPRTTDALVEWDDAELAMLQGSAHVARALRRRALVDAVYDEVFPAIEDADPGLFGGDGVGGAEDAEDVDGDAVGEGEVDAAGAARRKKERRRRERRERKAAAAAAAFTSRRAFRWAWATVLARAFELPDVAVARKAGGRAVMTDAGAGCGSGEMGLCPGLDLFNHGSEAEKCTVDGLVGIDGDDDSARRVDDDDGDDEDAEEDADGARVPSGPRITLRAGVGGVDAGEQLFHDYADHASGGALLEFGFTHHIPGPDAADALDTSTGDRYRVGSATWRDDARTRRDPRRDLHAVDISLSPLLREFGGDGENARRLARLASQPFPQPNVSEESDARASRGSLCRGLTYEVSNVGYAWEANGGRRVGVECIPPAAMQAARVLTLTGPELDALDAAGDRGAALPLPLSDAHERRALVALAGLFRSELARYESAHGSPASVVVAPTTVEEDDVILNALEALHRGQAGGPEWGMIPDWARERPEVANCLARSPPPDETPLGGAASYASEAAEEARAARWQRRARLAVGVRRGEKLLLEEIAGDLERMARGGE